MTFSRKLFGVPNAPYYIYAPPFSDAADGGKTLHYLCHALNLAGETAYVTETGSALLRTPLLTQDILERDLKGVLTPIAVYPEVIGDNPLNARTVVRYLLDAPGTLTGFPVHWREQDLLYTAAAEFTPPGMQAELLRIPHPSDDDPAREMAFWRQLTAFVAVTQSRARGEPPTTDDGERVATIADSRPAAPRIAANGARVVDAAGPHHGKTGDIDDGGSGTRKTRVLVYTVESTWSPCPQIRLIRPFAHLSARWELIWGIRDGILETAAIDSVDLIVFHRFTPGLMPISALEKIFAYGIPVVYESDDLLNAIPADHPEAAMGANWKAGIEYAARNADAIVVSTTFLADKYRALNPAVHVLPNYIDYDLFYRAPQPVADDGVETGKRPITIGLLGSSIQPSNFALVDAALTTLVTRYGTRLKLYFVGWGCPPGWENHPNVTLTGFIHEYVDYAAQLRQWDWDIALIPLEKDEYNQCKSYIKWLDYSAAGIATIFSDVSVYNEVVTHDETGFLIPNSSQAWLHAITMLIESPAKRHAMASEAQRQVRAGYDLRDKAALYEQVYGSLVRAGIES